MISRGWGALDTLDVSGEPQPEMNATMQPRRAETSDFMFYDPAVFGIASGSMGTTALRYWYAVVAA